MLRTYSARAQVNGKATSSIVCGRLAHKPADANAASAGYSACTLTRNTLTRNTASNNGTAPTTPPPYCSPVYTQPQPTVNWPTPNNQPCHAARVADTLRQARKNAASTGYAIKPYPYGANAKGNSAPVARLTTSARQPASKRAGKFPVALRAPCAFPALTAPDISILSICSTIVSTASTLISGKVGISLPHAESACRRRVWYEDRYGDTVASGSIVAAPDAVAGANAVVIHSLISVARYAEAHRKTGARVTQNGGRKIGRSTDALGLVQLVARHFTRCRAPGNDVSALRVAFPRNGDADGHARTRWGYQPTSSLSERITQQRRTRRAAGATGTRNRRGQANLE